MPRPRTARYTTFFCGNFECDAIKITRTSAYLSRTSHFCSRKCYFKSKNAVQEFVDVCRKCEAKMTEEDQYTASGSRVIKLCKVCREEKYETKLSLKEKKREKFVEKFNLAWIK